MVQPGTLNEAASGVRDGDVVVRFAMQRSAIERMLESAKAYRARINHKIAWCCVVPALGWFGRMARLEREYDRANNGVRDLLRLRRESF